MSSATAILVPVFGVVLLLALLTVVRLVRAVRPSYGGAAFVPVDPEILALEGEKRRILATIKDLDHEHALGKLSRADRDGLKRHFEREALEVIERLDRLQAERGPADGGDEPPSEDV